MRCRSKVAMRLARTLRSTICHRAMVTARSYRSGSARLSPQIAFAIRLTFVETVGSGFVAAAKPWRQAFRLDCNFPRKLVGPVLFFALVRLAALFLSEVIDVL